jgi:hypothetical protein
MKTNRYSTGIVPPILNLGTRRRQMVNFTPGRGPVSIELEAAWTPEPSWTSLEKRKFLAAAGIRTPDRPNSSESLHGM